jgi:uncharacterized protein YjfI (DUF2170 family)
MSKYIQPTIMRRLFRQVVPRMIATQKRLITVEALMNKFPTMTSDEKCNNSDLFIKVMTPLSRIMLQQTLQVTMKKYTAGIITINDTLETIENAVVVCVKNEMSPAGTLIRAQFGKSALTPTTELGDLAKKEDSSDSNSDSD